ncbi:hypothetical protein DFH27DRAFT_612793 [Peziza echinospora]|nr:hypothetical protein DFH27DRAFT_612793 [Peziza echinospora]
MRSSNTPLTSTGTPLLLLLFFFGATTFTSAIPLSDRYRDNNNDAPAAEAPMAIILRRDFNSDERDYERSKRAVPFTAVGTVLLFISIFILIALYFRSRRAKQLRAIVTAHGQEVPVQYSHTTTRTAFGVQRQDGSRNAAAAGEESGNEMVRPRTPPPVYADVGKSVRLNPADGRPLTPPPDFASTTTTTTTQVPAPAHVHDHDQQPPR